LLINLIWATRLVWECKKMFSVNIPDRRLLKIVIKSYGGESNQVFPGIWVLGSCTCVNTEVQFSANVEHTNIILIFRLNIFFAIWQSRLLSTLQTSISKEYEENFISFAYPLGSRKLCKNNKIKIKSTHKTFSTTMIITKYNCTLHK
jgi:hypothetical protein